MGINTYGKGKVEVDGERTKRDLNIDWLTLHHGSHRKIYVTCQRCGESFLRERRSLYQLHHCPVHIIRDDGVRLKWCNNCKMFLPYASFSNNAARLDGLSSWCNTCQNSTPAAKRHHAKYTALYKTPLGWLKHAVVQKRTHMKKSGVECTITYEDMVEQYKEQQGRCYWSHIELEFGTTSLRSASFERLDSNIGYVKGNVVLATKFMNWAKNQATKDEFNAILHELLANLNENTRLELRRLHPDAQWPFRQRSTDAGFDLYSVETVIVPPRDVVDVDTGIAIAAPVGYFYMVYGRSSMFLKRIIPYQAVIDATYTGPLKVALMNMAHTPCEIKKGDRIAQIILHKCYNFDLVEVSEFSPGYSIRGNAGFGSSGR